jgi:hypothetical protein
MLKALGKKGFLFLVALVAVIGGVWVCPEALYAAFVTAVGALYATFVSSNVAATHVTSKLPPKPEPEETP